MGSTVSFQNTYAIPLKNTECQDLTPILRAASHPDELVTGLPNEILNNAWDIFLRGKAMNNGENKCLGYRKRSEIDGSLAAEFTWLTYDDVYNIILGFGSALLDCGDAMDPLNYFDEAYESAQNLRLLGIFSKNRVEWFICEQAANAYNFAIVPLYDTLGQDALELILNQTRMKVVGTTLECLSPLLTGIEVTRHVKYLILFLDPHENLSEELRERCTKAGVQQVLNFKDLVNTQASKLHVRPPSPGNLKSINTVCFTSGTTGKPKGVLLTQGNVVSCCAGVLRGPVSQDFHISSADRTLSYLPLAHVLERLVCNIVFLIGASIGVYSGSTQQLLDDLQRVNPTVFVSVPRLFNRINDAVFQGIAKKSSIARTLCTLGVSDKLERLRSDGTTTNLFWDRLVFDKIRQLMGNNLRYMISGGAPLDANVQDHMKILFCVPLMEGFGLSETFGPAFLANPKDPVSGHVGGVIPCCEFRLKSVPDMNYRVTDCPPRGELLMRGPVISPGYFRDRAETEASYDKEGWLMTGDIAVVLPGGSLKIIDRKKNIFKLAQGEYVAPEKIENVYLQTPLVSQIFIFGYSDKSHLVAIVVPDVSAVEIWAKQRWNGSSTTFSIDIAFLAQSSELKNAVLQEMEVTAKTGNLKGFEKVKNIFLEHAPFTVENGILTPTLKIRRHFAKEKYEKRIQQLYNDLS